jgi:hypothetical protein
MEAERNANRLAEGDPDDQATAGDGEAENGNLRASTRIASLIRALSVLLHRCLKMRP